MENQDILQTYKECLLRTYIDLYVYIQSIRNIHWNLISHHFLALHQFTDEAYEEMSNFLDKFAERLRVSGLTLPTQLAVLENNRRLPELVLKSDLDMLTDFVQVTRLLIQYAQECNKQSAYCGDTATQDELIKLEKKLGKYLWMIRSVTEQPVLVSDDAAQTSNQHQPVS